MDKINFRTQLDPPLKVKEIDFPASIVQPGMSPSISEMVRTLRVGGTLGEYEQNGIASDAPFDSEYLDFFDMADAAEVLEAERQASKQAPQDGGKPPVKPGINQPPAESQEAVNE